MLARITKTSRTSALLGLILVGLATTAHADTPSYSVTGWDLEPTSGGYTLGYTFVPTHNIAVTAMGEWVPFGGTINGSEETGVFDSNGNLLFSSTYNQANATLTSNHIAATGSEFRYADITSIPLGTRTLSANQTYTYAATILSNNIATSAQGLTPGPGITITSGGLYKDGDTLSGPSPSAPTGSNGFNMYGVNFEYVPVEVAATTPEPGTWALLGGLTTCGLSLLRRRRNA